MRRSLLVISACAITALAAAPTPSARAQAIDAESAPVVNLASGQVIEVPPVAQPRDTPTKPPRAERAPAKPAPNPGDASRAAPTLLSESFALGASKSGHAKGTTAGAQTRRAATDSSAEPTDSGWAHWSVRTAVGLLLLIGMLWGLRWSAKKFGAGLGLAAQLGPAGRAPQGLLEVLGRYPVSRGHSLVLMRLDRRVLLLGQSPTGFTSLSELTDAEDVASVLTKAADADGASMSRRFSELLRGMERDPALVGAESVGPPPSTPRLAMRLAGTAAANGAGAVGAGGAA